MYTGKTSNVQLVCNNKTHTCQAASERKLEITYKCIQNNLAQRFCKNSSADKFTPLFKLPLWMYKLSTAISSQGETAFT